MSLVSSPVAGRFRLLCDNYPPTLQLLFFNTVKRQIPISRGRPPHHLKHRLARARVTARAPMSTEPVWTSRQITRTARPNSRF